MSMSLAEIIEQTKPRFQEIKPENMQYAAEIGFALQALKNNSYLNSVASGNTASLQQAITNVAAIGLSLNPAAKEAYLIPRSVKVENKYESRIFLEPSYVGLIRLATNSGSILWVQANLVYADDQFVDNGPGEKPTHTYNAFSKERGEIVGGYCVAKTKHGDFLTSIMPVDDINSIRNRSEAYKKDYGPWVSDYNEMAKKSIVRRAFKTWPRSDSSDRLDEAVNLSNENEGFEKIVNNPSIRDYTAEQKNHYDSLIENNKSFEMYCFQESLLIEDQDGVWTNLYHSFEKGQKGKFQQLVNSLVEAGRVTMNEYIENINQSLNDSLALTEVIEELDAEQLTVLKSKLSADALSAIESAEPHNA